MIPTSTSGETHVIPYYGRCVSLSVDDDFVLTTSSALRDFAEKIDDRRDKNWQALKGQLVVVVDKLGDEASTGSRSRFRLELLNDAVIPYLTKMKSRLSLEKSRFAQMERLIYLLSTNTSCSPTQDVHPSVTLQEIDKIVQDVNNTGGWFKSEMASLLEASVDRQWRPMVSEMRNALWNMGGALAAAGFVEVVGRPMLMLYPLTLLLTESVEIAKSIETNRGVNPSSYLKITKALILMVMTWNLLAILAAYSGIGYICLMVGIGAIVIASNDDMIRKTMPAIAPQLSNLALLVSKVKFAQDSVLSALSTGGNYTCRGDSQFQHIPLSNGVGGGESSRTIENDEFGGAEGIRNRKKKN